LAAPIAIQLVGFTIFFDKKKDPPEGGSVLDFDCVL
jgi:hypothetical protein